MSKEKKLGAVYFLTDVIKSRASKNIEAIQNDIFAFRY